MLFRSLVGTMMQVIFGIGHLMADTENYLHHGTNKQVFYRIYHSVDEIDEQAITRLLNEAIEIDKKFKSPAKRK